LQGYYTQASFGRYRPHGETSAWLQMPRPFDFYADGRRGIGGTYPRNARALVEDAVRAADSQVDFSRFDNDGPDGIAASGDDDGFVDALVVVHAGGRGRVRAPRLVEPVDADRCPELEVVPDVAEP
jgi:M6 family metalloprotease-like protein